MPNHVRGAFPTLPAAVGLTRWAELVALGDTPTEAARKAGYDRPESVGPLLAASPAGRKALADATAVAVQSNLIPLALGVMREVLTDKSPKAVAVRAKLAVALLDRVAKDNSATPDPGKPLQNMTTAELERLVAAGRQALEQEARTIDVTPVGGRNAGPAASETPDNPTD